MRVPHSRRPLAAGVPQADYVVVVVVTDGGNGLEEFFTKVLVSHGVKKSQFILVFWHASQHLEEFAKVWIPNATTRKVQVETWYLLATNS